MNQTKLSLLLIVFMSMIGTKLFAYDIKVANADGVTIYYRWINNKTELGVTYYNGIDAYSGNIIIPESVQYNGHEYLVTSIGDEAFMGERNLTSVTIPNSVTTIGNYAFCNCSSMTSITLPNSVTTIGNYAFSGCSSMTSVTISNNLKTIEQYAFEDCSNLTSVTIPNSVTSIGNCAFENCKNLTSIIVETNNTKYDSRDNCNAIIESKSNTLIIGCKNTVIPNSVTTIGDFAFSNCSSMTSVTIPNSVTYIGLAAFQNCLSLSSIVVEANNMKYDSRNNCNAIIETTSNKLILGCKNTIIPNGVEIISGKAFSNCIGLTSIVIPNSITSIQSFAFYGCINLTSIEIPNSVTSIGEQIFDGCIGLTRIVVETNNTKFDSRDNCNAIIETSSNTLIYGCQSTVIPNSVKSIGSSAFYGCSGLTSITIPNSVTSIGSSAFYGCSNLASVSIPNSVTTIGNYAFCNCSSMTSITLPNSLKSIGRCAFYNCSSMTSVTIPNNLKTIEQYAFYGCSSLTSITIPKNVTDIGEYAFLGCSGLITITSLNPTPPKCGFQVFRKVYATLQVPTGSKSAYQKAEWWKDFKKIVEIDPTGVQTITMDKSINGPIYDLNGRKLKEPRKGINIIGGKKVVMK